MGSISMVKSIRDNKPQSHISVIVSYSITIAFIPLTPVPPTQVNEMTKELILINPRKRSRRSTKSRKVKKMARRTTTRRKAPARRLTTRRKTTTKRRAAPARKSTSRKRSLAAKKAARTRAANKRRRSVAAKKGAAKRRRTTRRKTTTRRKAPARRRTTRRKAPARRRTTRRKATKRRTTRRKSPARRRTTRRKAAPKRRSTSRRRRVSRRRTTRARKMSLGGAYKFVMNNMTSFEAFAALGVGLVAGIKLPALAESLIARATNYNIDLTSTWRGPLAGAVLTGLLGYTLMSFGVVNSSVANTIALAGVTVGALNLASSYLGLPVPGVALQGGSAGFGFLGGDTMRDSDSIIAFGNMHPDSMEMAPMSGYQDMGRIVNVF